MYLQTTSRHTCGCEATDDILPKVVAFFRGRGHKAESYDSKIQIPEGLGLESSCLDCQLRTEEGVETAIAALHCGPDGLVTHELFEAVFVALIRIRLRQDERDADGILPPVDDEDSDGSVSTRNSTVSIRRRRRSKVWDWDNIWHEFAKAFELRRDRVNIAQLLRDLSSHDMITAIRDGQVYQNEQQENEQEGGEWWVSVLQHLGSEALLNYEDYVAAGLTERPAASVLSALRRDARLIQSIDDLFDLYVDIDGKMHGYVHAHKMLRIQCLCCCR